MSIAINIISLLGGLAMFLYGMRLMSGSLKEGSSGALKRAMEKVTNNPIKAFLLGVAITAIIQSSTATIVITSGLVAAGIISLRQSLGIIIGANVGTTVTGQIIRLLDLNTESGSILEFFKPSTLAPLALIIGILLIMGFKFQKSGTIGNIAIGFGILFTGLLGMSTAVSAFNQNGFLESLFLNLGDKPVLAYLCGAGVAFLLQSSSATIGILQAIALNSGIPFYTTAFIVVGIYLGDCVTTAIVCSIGAKPDAKRVGLVNILFNLSETVLVIIGLLIAHQFGWLDSLWTTPLSPGGIANMNTIFNLSCAILLLPLVGVYEKTSKRLIKDKVAPKGKYASEIESLNPYFFNTPAIAFRSSYGVLKVMLASARMNITKALDQIQSYDDKVHKAIEDEENQIDLLTDRNSNYLAQLSKNISEDYHIRILDQYYKLTSEFERLGDYAMNIAESAQKLHEDGITLSPEAIGEIGVIRLLMVQILDYTQLAFEKRNVEAARHIEPLEEVVDDLVNALHDNHIRRIRKGDCSMESDACYLDILTNLERISDTCSNVGVSVIARVNPDLANLSHSYISSLHQGSDESYNTEYRNAHDDFFNRLQAVGERETSQIQFFENDNPEGSDAT